MTSLGLGFAGVGLLGQMMIERVADVPTLHLAAVQDANLERANQVAQKYSSPWFGERFEDLLTSPLVDVVVISTPNTLHVPQARAALEAGKHVLVQKPLATSARDARMVVDLAAARQLVLFVDYSYRLLESATALRAALPEIGAVRSMSAAFHNVHGPDAGRPWFTDPELSGGGALVDLGVHMLDLLLWVYQPRQVAVDGAALLRPPGALVEHRARMELHLDDVPVRMAVSWHAPRPLTDIHITIEGERGRLRWRNIGGSFSHFRTGHGRALLIDHTTSLRENTLRAFAAALASGSAPPIDTRVYDLLDQAYQRG